MPEGKVRLEGGSGNGTSWQGRGHISLAVVAVVEQKRKATERERRRGEGPAGQETGETGGKVERKKGRNDGGCRGLRWWATASFGCTMLLFIHPRKEIERGGVTTQQQQQGANGRGDTGDRFKRGNGSTEEVGSSTSNQKCECIHQLHWSIR
jgi:hypothetical protein